MRADGQFTHRPLQIFNRWLLNRDVEAKEEELKKKALGIPD